jgi:UDP-N-acetylglucosamine diphosphorylase/glucosamine-1-phosphate N-acetyltransferase
MNIILFGDDHWFDLLPLTFTRPIAEIRVGILTIKEKWEKLLGHSASYITQDYLSEKYRISIQEENLLINSTFLPTPFLIEEVKRLKLNQAIIINEEMIAAKVSKEQLNLLNEDPETFNTLESLEIDPNNVNKLVRLTSLHHIFELNSQEIVNDFNLITKGRESASISETNKVLGNNGIFLEEGVSMECCIINTTEGPVYIGKQAQVMEGSLLRGPIAICDHAIVKMGSKIYGGTTAGPYCRLGGEVKNVVMFANSNKGHEGFLGDSVIGEWCNIGADTNTSNLKNNYQPVKLWSYPNKKFENTGLQFCGLIMGDHSKCGINTMFNTGTVVGVACNVFGDGYPRNFIPSFSWGGAAGFTDHHIDKAIETATTVMARRNQLMSDVDQKIIRHIYNLEDK